MRKLIVVLILALLAVSLIWLIRSSRQDGVVQDYPTAGVDKPSRAEKALTRSEKRPNDWFYLQRAYPFDAIPEGKPLQAIQDARTMRQAHSPRGGKAVVWEAAGPKNIPGRLTDIAVARDDLSLLYVGSAAGGVFRSDNFGSAWTPIFDDEGVPSVGALAVHPDDHNILYVGTGEANAARAMYEGTGIYKTTDGNDAIDVGDITACVAYIFMGGTGPAPCL